MSQRHVAAQTETTCIRDVKRGRVAGTKSRSKSHVLGICCRDMSPQVNWYFFIIYNTNLGDILSPRHVARSSTCWTPWERLVLYLPQLSWEMKLWFEYTTVNYVRPSWRLGPNVAVTIASPLDWGNWGFASYSYPTKIHMRGEFNPEDPHLSSSQEAMSPLDFRLCMICQVFKTKICLPCTVSIDWAFYVQHTTHVQFQKQSFRLY